MAHIQGLICDLGQCSITSLHPWPSCLFLNKIGVILFKQIYQMIYYSALNSSLLCLNIVMDIISKLELSLSLSNFFINSMNIYLCVVMF